MISPRDFERNKTHLLQVLNICEFELRYIQLVTFPRHFEAGNPVLAALAPGNVSINSKKCEEFTTHRFERYNCSRKANGWMRLTKMLKRKLSLKRNEK
jgi:hypothetical protein